MGPRMQAVKQRYLDSKIGQHLSEHKALYLTGVSCFVTGFLTGQRGGSVIGEIEGTNNQFIGKAKSVTIIHKVEVPAEPT